MTILHLPFSLLQTPKPPFFKLYPPLKTTKKAPVIGSFYCLKPSAYSQLIITVVSGYLYLSALDHYYL